MTNNECCGGLRTVATSRCVHTSTSLHIHILYTQYMYYTHTIHALYTHSTCIIHTIHVLYTQYMYYTHYTHTVHILYTQYMYYTHSMYIYVPTCTNCTQGAHTCPNQLHMFPSVEVWGIVA